MTRNIWIWGSLALGLALAAPAAAQDATLPPGPAAESPAPAAAPVAHPDAATPAVPHAAQADATPAPTAQALAPAEDGKGEPDPLEFSDVEPPLEEDSPDAAVQDEEEQEDAVAEPAAPGPEAPAPGPGVPRHGVPVVADPNNPFPAPPVIAGQRDFWIRVFTRLPSDHGLLHDGRISQPVWEELDISGLRPKEQHQFVKHRTAEVAASLRDLADAMEQNKAPDEAAKRLQAQLPRGATPDDVRDFARNLRFQRGLSDRFESGVVRAGAFDVEIRRILREHNVPEDLVNLPHVESTYNNATHSKAGAIGIWQFTRGTGKLFMNVGYEVDERLDQLVAARAAAKFLRQNFDRLGTWPLAITAYNHGPQSLEKIVGRMGTTDLAELIQHYDGPLFKFASKNFYSEFLAAREVADHYADYFGDIKLADTLEYKRVELPFFLEFERAAQVLGVNRLQLAQLNPALRPAVLAGSRYIPKGYRLRVPPTVEPQAFLASVPAAARKTQQKAMTEIRVARGDSLFAIGRRYNIPWSAIAAANNLGPRGRIWPGQKLILPQRNGSGAITLAALPAEAAPASKAVAAAAPSAPAATVAAKPAESPVLAAAPAPAPVAAAASSATVLPAGPPAPVVPTVASADSAPRLKAVQAVAGRSYDHLALQNYDPQKKEGRLRAAYGETLGHYADWAQVSAQEIRAANDFRTHALQPGRMVTIPLGNVDRETFDKQRMLFHQQREQSFFSEFSIADTEVVNLRQGQTIWNVAQSRGVPMWLLYRENPDLLQRPPQVGTRVTVPVLREAPVAASGANPGN